MHLSMVTHWCCPYAISNIVRMWGKFTILKKRVATAVGDNRFDHRISDWIVSLIPAPTQKVSVGMYS